MLDYSLEEISPSSKDVRIHPQAIVYKGAELGVGVMIGPRAIVGPHVRLGDGVVVGAGAVIEGHTTIGSQTKISSYATLGSDPQDLKYKGEPTELHIGSHNSIREYVNISTGTVSGSGKTVVGDNNLIMVYSHIAHDCVVGNHCIFANGVHLAGHVVVGDRVVFGGMSGGHQFCRFGDRAMIAAGAIVVQDVPPFCMVQGDRARISGLNVVGLRRSDLPKERISDIKNMFRFLFNENLTVEDAINRILAEISDSPERASFVDFIKASERGICR